MRPFKEEAIAVFFSAYSARRNILMFGDGGWQSHVTRAQYARLECWLADTSRLLVIELGAGTNVPTVRHFSEAQGAPLIRINPTEPQLGAARGLALAAGARAALEAIDALL